MAAPSPIVWLDCETTGLDPSQGHEVLELAAARVNERGEVSDTFAVKVWPVDLSKASKRALEINQFDEAVWRVEGVPREQAIARLDRMIGAERVAIGGHNTRFDLSFLAHLKPWLVLDTMTLAWPLYVRKQIGGLSLDVLCKHFGVTSRLARHSAAGDVARTIGCYCALMGLAMPDLGPAWDLLADERRAG